MVLANTAHTPFMAQALEVALCFQARFKVGTPVEMVDHGRLTAAGYEQHVVDAVQGEIGNDEPVHAANAPAPKMTRPMRTQDDRSVAT